MKIDLHCHSEASWDCITPLSKIVERCHEQGITVQAITDHDQIWGAQKLAEMTSGSDLQVIVGEEVTTAQGEIIGLFLNELIPPGLSAQETVAAIRAQGGLVLLPHGFDPLKKKRLEPSAREQISDEIDIVEVFNARVSKPERNEQAREWAVGHGKSMSGGTDAHTLRDVGQVWCRTCDRTIEAPQDLLQALAEGKVQGEWTHPIAALAYKAFDWGRHHLIPG